MIGTDEQVTIVFDSAIAVIPGMYQGGRIICPVLTHYSFTIRNSSLAGILSYCQKLSRVSSRASCATAQKEIRAGFVATAI